MNDNIVDFQPKKEAAPSPVGTATGGDVMTVTTQVRIPRNIRLAQGLFENKFQVWPVSINGEDKPFGLVVNDESCAICGGYFPPAGELRGFYDDRRIFNLVHIGCLVDVGNWIEK